MKAAAVVLLFVVLAFCAFGFLATLEPMEGGSPLNWRIAYGGAGAASIVLLVWLLRRGRSKK